MPAVRPAARPARPRLPEDERPPRAAAVSRPDDERTREVLAEGDLEVHGRIPDSSNATLLVTARLGGDEVLAVFKPERGERPLWDFPPGLWRREVAAYELDALLGTGCVPLTVARDDRTSARAPCSDGCTRTASSTTSRCATSRELADWFRALAALDVVANNTDRKSGPRALGGRPVLGDRQRAVLPRRRQAAHGHLGVRRRARSTPRSLERLGAVADGDVDVLRGLLDAEEVARHAAPRRASSPTRARCPSPTRTAASRRGPGRSCDSGAGQLTPRPPTVAAP